MNDITSVLPQPTVVALGEGRYPILPLRLADVARLQGFVAAAIPCPLDADARARLDDPATPQPERRKLLRDLWRGCKHWPPRYGSPEADQAFRSPAGRLFFAALVFESSAVAISVEELARELSQATPEQLRALASAAFAVRPIEALNHRVAAELGERGPEDDPDPDDDDQGDLNWAEAFAEVAHDTGWTFDEIGALRLPAWRAIRTRGKAKLRALDDSHEALVRRCRFFDGELDDEPDQEVSDDTGH